MAEQKKKTNSNNKKNNTKKVETTKKVNTNKNTNTSKKVTNTKEVKNTSKKEVKKVLPKEEIKVEQIVAEEVKTEKVSKEKKTFKLTSKQRDLVLVLLVGVLLVIALVLTGKKEPELDIELPIALEGTAGFTEITYSEYAEKLNTEAPFVVVIVNDGCGYCEMYEPIVEEVANEYGLPINYINLANLTNDEYNKLGSSNSYLRKEQWGTPTTLFMYGETVVDSIGGYVEKDTLVEFVKENFVIGE